VSRAATKLAEQKEVLEDLRRHYDARFLDSDPVGIVRRFEDPRDREATALLAAGLAYGRVASIRASLLALLERMGTSPGRFVAGFDPLRDAPRFDGFAHRFTRGRDVALLIHLVRQAQERAGSLESFFLEGDTDPETTTLGPALQRFGARLFALDARPFVAEGPIPRGDGARWLLPLPSGGSACKRSCLFLRWMVRPDDGVDCGLWTRVRPSRLVLPLDTHLLRVVAALGWTRRKTAGWAMALEVTERLRRLDPDDPTRFDFALCRLGILGRLDAPEGRLTPHVLRMAMAAR
jgi:uncharacterized protein (TIGR02757 family)